MPELKSLGPAALIVIAVALLAGWLLVALARRAQRSTTTVFEYQAGLLYRNGVFAETLRPGRYSTFWPGTAIVVEDMREQMFVVAGQEVLTADNLGVKASVAVRHRTTDARRKLLASDSPILLLHSDLQIALRQAIAARTLEALLAERGGIATELRAAAAATAASRGIEILAVDVRDLMLTGEAKRAYADIFRARKDGEAALERARGETAALRNLANGARLLAGNPALYQLRLLQTLATSAAKGATVVLNTSGEPALVTPAPPADDARPRPAPRQD